MSPQPVNQRNKGFTLIEIMVVIAIAAVISTITFGAFRSVAEGNKRSTCQSNLSQIYQACRLYAQDYNGKFPYFNTQVADQPTTPGLKEGGNGLWSLYVYPKFGSENCPGDVPDLPLSTDSTTLFTGYIRSPKIFHCPADKFKRDAKYRVSAAACSSVQVESSALEFAPTGTDSYLNPTYLSYQMLDDFPLPPVALILPQTYASFRASGAGTRQITTFVTNATVNIVPDLPTRPATVITWCRFHRSLDAMGATNTAKRNFDNVLFSDGTVQSLPIAQNVSEKSLNPQQCYSWQRVPKELADSLKSASSCNLGP